MGNPLKFATWEAYSQTIYLLQHSGGKNRLDVGKGHFTGHVETCFVVVVVLVASDTREKKSDLPRPEGNVVLKRPH